ncbi:MAG TPA: ABC transporter permease [Bacteroidales bacterium]|nr:ABC transporter permease [Bacteroidales bacterium]
MIKNYLKIFGKVAKQNKLYTFLSLFGISLTIMFVMIFSMTITKIITGSGPEKDLENILFAEKVTHKYKSGGGSGETKNACGTTLSEDYLKKIKSADKISMYYGIPWEFIYNGKYQLKEATPTDAEYWEVFKYNFLQGRPYSKEEVKTRENVAVISQSLQKLLFGDEKEVLGKIIHYPSSELIVVGVVEDPPIYSQNAKGDLYFPYTIQQTYQYGSSAIYAGSFKVAFKAVSPKQFKAIQKEVQDIITRLDIADTVSTVFLAGPYSQIEKVLAREQYPENYSMVKKIIKYLAIAFAFILLPAINLMALNFARIQERGEEIAIRKSFGASGSSLRGQILFENILMTLLGGIIGVVLSLIFVAFFGNLISIPLTPTNNVPLSFSFNINVFIIALASSLVFGLFSGYLPAVGLSKMKPALYLKGGEL